MFTTITITLRDLKLIRKTEDRNILNNQKFLSSSTILRFLKEDLPATT